MDDLRGETTKKMKSKSNVNKSSKTVSHQQMVSKMLKNPAVKVEVKKLNHKEFDHVFIQLEGTREQHISSFMKFAKIKFILMCSFVIFVILSLIFKQI